MKTILNKSSVLIKKKIKIPINKTIEILRILFTIFMLNIVQSSFQPDAFTIERKGNSADIYMRKNIHSVTETIEEVESTHYEWDEAYAKFEGLDIPTASMLEDNFDWWFDKCGAWRADGGVSNIQLRADVDYLAVMSDIPLN